MSNGLSISGYENDWLVFGKKPPGGHEVLFTTGAANPAVQAYALDMGKRDLFVAARDLDDLRAGIKAATSARTVSLKFAPAGEEGLCLSPEQRQAAIAQKQSGSGGLLGKLFGH